MWKKLLLPVFILTLIPAFPVVMFAYDDDTTHPTLTDETVDFYNALHPDAPLTSDQKEWLVQGSINEDDWPRWLNHFYDPVRKIGWSGEYQGAWPVERTRARVYAGVAPFGTEILPATEWVHNSAIQKLYELYGGDRTWGRARMNYPQNREKWADIIELN